MAIFAVTNTFSAGSTITAAGHNTNWSDVTTWLNNRYNGTDTWLNMKVSATAANPVDIASSGSTTEVSINNTATDGDPILSFELSGTAVVTMGVDDSDSDIFKIGTTGITTNTRLALTTAGKIGLGGEVEPDELLHITTTTGATIKLESTDNSGASILEFNGKNAGATVQRWRLGMGIALTNAVLELRDVTRGAQVLEIDGNGVLNYVLAAVAVGGGAAATLGTIGGAGPSVAGQNAWMKVKVAGTDSYIPFWR